MKVLLSWLKEFAPDIDGDPVELGETLSALGLAVESMSIIGEELSGVVVGQVLELKPHPNAERIQLVDVDLGDGEPTQICCGAFNMSVGDFIPVATIGTVMPGGMEIAQRELRGELSNGMCCSASEIGMGLDSEGIMILSNPNADLEIGTPLNQALGIEPDVLWDLEVNANRPDAMSVAGVARDLAAALQIPFAFPRIDVGESGNANETNVSVRIQDASLCGRFLTRVIKGVSVGPSPRWLQNRLVNLGMRPINNVVDISNYVMLELGQPNHTYDMAKVAGGILGVRRASNGELITTLDGTERELSDIDGVITDADDKPIGIAGIMGGESTEISETTEEIIVEVAWWDPPSISRTVKRLNLMSEASIRFRRGVDYGENMVRAVDRVAELLAECGGVATSGIVEAKGDLPDRSPIIVRPAKINALLGTGLTPDAMERHLSSIGFEITQKRKNLNVTVPTWRWDTETETDVAEEIARMHGYENIARTVPRGSQAGELSQFQKDRRLVREVLVGVGFDETMPMPFLAPGDLKLSGLPEEAISLSNPLVHEESLLRTSLLPGQLKLIAYNQSHRINDLKFFEIGHIFLPPDEGDLLPDEREHLSVAIVGEDAPSAVKILNLLGNALVLPNLQLKELTADGLHPRRSSSVLVAGKPYGHVGEISPRTLQRFGITGRVAWLELDLGKLLEGPHGKRRYVKVSKYPTSDIDLAFDVPESVRSAEIEGCLRKGGGKLLSNLMLFDSYKGESMGEERRSLAYRLRFQSTETTLTDSQIGELRQKCIDEVQKKTKARIRE
ncbi:MAG TPA: phenylalanine--tRNA ligase subunit beta [Acidimicrobiales bacterium]|nr:phenylalanine--tRNA ligase subunit beta [Acidimicrobiales bacterium]